MSAMRALRSFNALYVFLNRSVVGNEYAEEFSNREWRGHAATNLDVVAKRGMQVGPSYCSSDQQPDAGRDCHRQCAPESDA